MVLKKWNNQKIQSWTPVYAKFKRYHLTIFLLGGITLFILFELGYNLETLIELYILSLLASAVPYLIWEIKTGYLTSPIFFFSFTERYRYKIKAISRLNNPFWFWISITYHTALYIFLSFLMLYILASDEISLFRYFSG